MENVGNNTYDIIYQNANKLLSIYHFKSYQVRILFNLAKDETQNTQLYNSLFE